MEENSNGNGMGSKEGEVLKEVTELQQEVKSEADHEEQMRSIQAAEKEGTLTTVPTITSLIMLVKMF